MRNAATPSIRTVGPGRDFAERAAVHRLDLEVNCGEVQGLLGPSGSGKSTTVRMLTTMLRPSPGTAQVTGADITRDPGAVRRHTGVVLQGTALDSLISAREPLRLQGRLQSLTARQARARRTELLTAFNAEEFPDTSVGKLSGGRRRRIDLAVALVQRPDTLFLDSHHRARPGQPPGSGGRDPRTVRQPRHNRPAADPAFGGCLPALRPRRHPPRRTPPTPSRRNLATVS